MTDQTTDEDFLPLSPDFLSQIFPVARSHRRGNADLFAAFLPEDQQRDDAAFYAALARMVTCDEGLAALRACDRRMIARNDGLKAFGTRALRWLMNRNPDANPAEIMARSPEDLLPLSATSPSCRCASAC